MHPAACVVSYNIVRNRRRLAGTPEERENPCGPDIVEIMPDQVAIRTGLPEARDRAIDQARVARREFLVIDSEPLGDARPVFLDDHVGALSEPIVNFFAGAALQVNANRFL